MSEANKQKEEDVAETALVRHATVVERLLLMVVEEMEEMFLRLVFSQTVAMKLVDDQGTDSPWTLSSLSDEDTTTICDEICRPGGLMSRKTLD